MPLGMILVGSALDRLKQMPDRSARCCVTSPPYWGLRDYGTEPIAWPDGSMCSLGLEPTPELYIDHLVEIFREVRRVLTDDGTCWINIGDCYAGSGKGGNPQESEHKKQRTNAGSYSVATGRIKPIVGQTARDAAMTNVSRRLTSTAGYKAKDLIGIPFMLAFVLRVDGWWWRAPIIWSKPNPMPGSQQDRPTISHEYIWLMSKSQRYFYDHESVMEPAVNKNNWSPADGKNESDEIAKFSGGRQRDGFNKRWTSKRLAEAAISRTGGIISGGVENSTLGVSAKEKRTRRTVWEIAPKPFKEAHFATYPPALIEPCVLAGSAIGDTVLDPFCGSGTTGIVALSHGRDFIGIDLSRPYTVDIAVPRILRETGVECIVG